MDLDAPDLVRLDAADRLLTQDRDERHLVSSTSWRTTRSKTVVIAARNAPTSSAPSIIPSLPPGVFVHVHDIFLPYLYHRDVLGTDIDWQETTLLDSLELLCCESALHYERPGELTELLSAYRAKPGVGGITTRSASSSW